MHRPSWAQEQNNWKAEQNGSDPITAVLQCTRFSSHVLYSVQSQTVWVLLTVDPNAHRQWRRGHQCEPRLMSVTEVRTEFNGEKFLKGWIEAEDWTNQRTNTLHIHAHAAILVELTLFS